MWSVCVRAIRSASSCRFVLGGSGRSLEEARRHPDQLSGLPQIVRHDGENVVARLHCALGTKVEDGIVDGQSLAASDLSRKRDITIAEAFAEPQEADHPESESRPTKDPTPRYWSRCTGTRLKRLRGAAQSARVLHRRRGTESSVAHAPHAPQGAAPRGLHIAAANRMEQPQGGIPAGHHRSRQIAAVIGDVQHADVGEPS